MTARLEISSAGYPDGGFCTSYVPVVVVAGNTMRPTPLERLPQSEVHVHIGYVADELCESVKIIYEFEVRHGNWPVTVRGGYTFWGIRSYWRELTASVAVVWVAVFWALTQNGKKSDHNAKGKKTNCPAMVKYIGKVIKDRRSKEDWTAKAQYGHCRKV